jgi:hypothetical protein
MSVGDRDTTWLTVGGQILNATERELRIANFSIRLTVDGHAVLDQPFVPTFAQFHPNRFDPDKTFDTLAPFEGVVSLPDFATYFVCGFDLPSVPETFEHATLHLVLNYKIGSRCGTAVVKTAVARLKPLVVSSPLQGRWDFGNSPDHRVFDAHAWPGQRFSIDFTKLGDDGKPFKPDQPLNENRTFWAYGRPIHAIAPGTVVSETDANVEGFGMTENDESAINYVLIHHRDSDGPGGNFYHGYYHVRKDKNAVSVGDNVDTGQHIADVGNAAAAEPHLHLGTGRRDATGNGTPIPLVFRDLTSVDGAPVHDVPATAEYVAPS